MEYLSLTVTRAATSMKAEKVSPSPSFIYTAKHISKDFPEDEPV